MDNLKQAFHPHDSRKDSYAQFGDVNKDYS